MIMIKTNSISFCGVISDSFKHVSFKNSVAITPNIPNDQLVLSTKKTPISQDLSKMLASYICEKPSTLKEEKINDFIKDLQKIKSLEELTETFMNTIENKEKSQICRGFATRFLCEHLEEFFKDNEGRKDDLKKNTIEILINGIDNPVNIKKKNSLYFRKELIHALGENYTGEDVVNTLKDIALNENIVDIRNEAGNVLLDNFGIDIKEEKALRIKNRHTNWDKKRKAEILAERDIHNKIEKLTIPSPFNNAVVPQKIIDSLRDISNNTHKNKKLYINKLLRCKDIGSFKKVLLNTITDKDQHQYLKTFSVEIFSEYFKDLIDENNKDDFKEILKNTYCAEDKYCDFVLNKNSKETYKRNINIEARKAIVHLLVANYKDEDIEIFLNEIAAKNKNYEFGMFTRKVIKNNFVPSKDLPNQIVRKSISTNYGEGLPLLKDKYIKRILKCRTVEDIKKSLINTFTNNEERQDIRILALNILSQNIKHLIGEKSKEQGILFETLVNTYADIDKFTPYALRRKDYCTNNMKPLNLNLKKEILHFIADNYKNIKGRNFLRHIAISEKVPIVSNEAQKILENDFHYIISPEDKAIYKYLRYRDLCLLDENFEHKNLIPIESNIPQKITDMLDYKYNNNLSDEVKNFIKTKKLQEIKKLKTLKRILISTVNDEEQTQFVRRYALRVLVNNFNEFFRPYDKAMVYLKIILMKIVLKEKNYKAPESQKINQYLREEAVYALGKHFSSSNKAKETLIDIALNKNSNLVKQAAIKTLADNYNIIINQEMSLYEPQNIKKSPNSDTCAKLKTFNYNLRNISKSQDLPVE